MRKPTISDRGTNVRPYHLPARQIPRGHLDQRDAIERHDTRMALRGDQPEVCGSSSVNSRRASSSPSSETAIPVVLRRSIRATPSPSS
jgi:hypothetical protein